MAHSVLLVEDEASIREAYALNLGTKGYQVQTAKSGEEGLSILQKVPVDILVLDMMMAGLSGLDVLKEVQRMGLDLPVILLTARGTVRDAVEAMRLGAFDFVMKSIDMEDLALALSNASRFLTLSREAGYWSGKESGRFSLDLMVAESPRSISLKKQIREMSSNDQITVLLQGETGSGKEYIAKVIHYNSARRERPFIEVDCPAIPADLFESELFGYEKGAFTGAVARKVGLLELAEGGTVLLDEIGDLPLHLQAKLLRVIEERTIRRVGGGAHFPVHVRFMAATHKDLRQAVKNGQFREDLYYRLNVLTLEIPALRERKEDILPIAERFMFQSAQSFRKEVRQISSGARELLLAHDFPGNIRELSNLVERAVMFCQGTRLEEKNFPPDIPKSLNPEPPSVLVQTPAAPVTGPTRAMTGETIPLSFKLGEDTLEEHERRLVETVLSLSGGNKTMASGWLGISRWALDRRIKAEDSGTEK